MLEVPFTINSQSVVHLENQVVNVSIPFAKSSLFSTKMLCIQVDNKELINEKNTITEQQVFQADFTTLALWPDGSIKWLLCEFISHQNITKYCLIEQKTPIKTQLIQQVTKIKQENTIDIACTKHTYTLNKTTLGFQCLPWSINLLDKNNEELPIQVSNIEYITPEKKLTKTLLFNGYFGNSTEDKSLSFDATFTFCYQLNTVKIDFVLRNEKPMVGMGGKWDLGNENSVLFNACNVIFKHTNAKVQLNNQKSWLAFNNESSLFQASSGGQNWQCDNHVNANRKNTLAFQGYQFTEKSSIISEGLRASPSVSLLSGSDDNIEYSKDKTFYIHLKDFWQNFPKSIERVNNNVVLGLFPSQHNQAHELQPGEQKTHTFYIALDNASLEAIKSPLNINISPKYLASTNTLPFFAINESSKGNDAIDALIQLGLTHKNNFFEKREQIDEFGWRNFGDIYADHETLEYKDDNTNEHTKNSILISHYNNQYDPLYGFLRQYLLTNNDQWRQLAEDLSQHIKDIDIYHTHQDKVEYNQGLFWHTDHYLPAETATHRTYSKYQKADAYQDHAGGGGPGGQHCYTTGLALHYLLTGNQSSKDTVLNLAQWITYVYEGNGSFFDTLLKIKNKEYPGVKNVITNKYPLDRGTGNYIVALIDAYQVSNKQSYLDQASLIIKQTASPTENLNDRHLNNIEECWFYTVFLQAVTRYLEIKEQLNQFDESFYYTQALLLHFANWMSEFEQPYLHTPDALEYPNHTWAAQDIRKANVLYLSAHYAQKYTNTSLAVISKYQQKANEIYQYVELALTNEKTHYFSRILSILMQNHGIKSYVEVHSSNNTAINNSAIIQDISAIKTVDNSDSKAWKLLCQSLLNTTVKTELTWLRQRVKKIDNVLLKLGSKP